MGTETYVEENTGKFDNTQGAWAHQEKNQKPPPKKQEVAGHKDQTR